MSGYSDLEIKSTGKFMKIDPGQPRVIRLLDESPVERTIHGFGKDAIKCIGDGCLKCATGKDEPKQRFKANVYDHGLKKVLLWEFGPAIAKQLKIIDKSLAEEGRVITQADLKVEASGSNLTKKYNVTIRLTSQTVPADLKMHSTEDEIQF